jgi:hypothetical protein
MESRSTTVWTSRQTRASITTRRKMASLRVSLQRRQGRLKEQLQAALSRVSAGEQADLNLSTDHTRQMFRTAASSISKSEVNLSIRR